MFYCLNLLLLKSENPQKLRYTFSCKAFPKLNLAIYSFVFSILFQPIKEILVSQVQTLLIRNGNFSTFGFKTLEKKSTLRCVFHSSTSQCDNI